MPVVNSLALYVQRTTALLPPRCLEGWHIVLDTANGAACVSSRTALRTLGAAVTLIGHEPDGKNINAGVGSQHPELMSAQVRATGARLGIATLVDSTPKEMIRRGWAHLRSRNYLPK